MIQCSTYWLSQKINQLDWSADIKTKRYKMIIEPLN